MTQYEIPEGWFGMDDLRKYGLSAEHPNGSPVNLMLPSGVVYSTQLYAYMATPAIAWCPIVPPKVKRWRADKGGTFYCVNSDLDIAKAVEHGYEWQTSDYAIGNYYRTREEAEAAAVRVKKAYQGDQP